VKTQDALERECQGGCTTQSLASRHKSNNALPNEDPSSAAAAGRKAHNVYQGTAVVVMRRIKNLINEVQDSLVASHPPPQGR